MKTNNNNLPVVAQDFSLVRDFKTGRATAKITFVCPNCGKLHSRREIYLQIPARFGVVGYMLACGYVRVVMPWEVSPPAMAAYGQHILLSAIKYLDGAPSGCEGAFTVNERRAAIRIMLSILPRSTRRQLEAERANFWA